VPRGNVEKLPAYDRVNKVVRLKAGFHDPVSSDHSLTWSCGVVRMTFQFDGEPSVKDQKHAGLNNKSHDHFEYPQQPNLPER